MSTKEHGGIKYPLKEMIILYKKLDRSYVAVARAMGCSRELVRQKLSPLGLVSSRLSHVELSHLMRTLYESGVSIVDIAKKMKCTEVAVRNRLKSLNMELRRQTKYDPVVLVKLYKRHKGNYSQMAEEMDLPSSSVFWQMDYHGLREKYPAMGRSK